MKIRILKKAVTALLTIYIIITISFLMVRFMPGDPLVHLVGQDRYYELLNDSPAELERIASKYGLDKSLGEQYVSYLKSIVTMDFGIAYSNKEPVLDNVLYRIRWTLVLSLPTFIAGGFFGALLGIFAGWKPGEPSIKCAHPLCCF